MWTFRGQVRVKCNPDDTIGDLKKLIAAQTGTKADKIRLRECQQLAPPPSPLATDHQAASSPSSLPKFLCSSALLARARADSGTSLFQASAWPRPNSTLVPFAVHAMVELCMRPHDLLHAHSLARHPAAFKRAEKWYSIFKDHITLEDYEIHDGMGLELYYN